MTEILRTYPTVIEQQIQLDHYIVLGVSYTATKQQIKVAYKNLARKHHPDRGGTEKQFQQLKAAYDTLNNTETRELYDEKLRIAEYAVYFSLINQYNVVLVALLLFCC